MTANRIHQEDIRDEFMRVIPLKMIPGTDSLVWAIVFHACNEASGYMAGAEIKVDGGISWGGAGVNDLG